MAGVQLPKGFDREHAKVIRELETLGWTFTMSKQGHAIGRAPDGVTTTSVSGSKGSPRNLKNVQATLRQWQRKVGATESGVKFVAAAEALSDPEEGRIDPVLDAVLMKAAEKHARASIEEAVQTSERREVSVRSWVSKRNSQRRTMEATLEENDRVDEVTFSDGSQEWRCTFEGCDYVSDKSGRSVALHYGQTHVRSGDAEPLIQKNRPVVATHVPISEDTMRPYRPTERLHAALAAFLRDAGTSDPDGLAYAALQWFHDRPDLERVEDVQPRDRTPEQILDAVRRLVGGRDLALEAQHVEALSEIAAQQERIAALEAECSRLRTTLATLSELAREEVKD